MSKSSTSRLPKAVVIRATAGSTELPCFELDRAEILKAGGRAKTVPLPNPAAPPTAKSGDLGTTQDSPLAFNAWPFFHAAAKTELARSFSAHTARLHGIVMSAMLRYLLRWQTTNLRLQDNTISSRKDSSRSYYSGRLGEACAYLFMRNFGYTYWDHLPSLVARAINRQNISHAEKTKKVKLITASYRKARKKWSKSKSGPMPQPDFVFEKPTSEVALMESKGRFVSPGDLPRYHSDLHKAVSQLGWWASLIQPTPTKSYAIGTYLREESDNRDQSLMAFVDPEEVERGDLEPVSFPKDWIRRGNFGAWLLGMELDRASQSLRNGVPREGQPVELDVIRFAGRDFAVARIGFPCGSTFSWQPSSLQDYRSLTDAHRKSPGKFDDILVAGIEVTTMRIIEIALHEIEQPILLRSEPTNIGLSEHPAWFSGSVLYDGTLFGLVHMDERFDPQAFSTDTFKL